jgi:hypothetical protein
LRREEGWPLVSALEQLASERAVERLQEISRRTDEVGQSAHSALARLGHPDREAIRARSAEWRASRDGAALRWLSSVCVSLRPRFASVGEAQVWLLEHFGPPTHRRSDKGWDYEATDGTRVGVSLHDSGRPPVSFSWGQSGGPSWGSALRREATPTLSSELDRPRTSKTVRAAGSGPWAW